MLGRDRRECFPHGKILKKNSYFTLETTPLHAGMLAHSKKEMCTMPSKLTASLTVRISPEVDRLRRELEQVMGLPANSLVEVALRRLKADLDRCGGPEQARPDEALRSHF